MIGLLACTPPLVPASGEAVYVWQGAWTPEVRAAAKVPDTPMLFVLHAEVSDTVRTVDVPELGPHAAVIRADTLAHLAAVPIDVPPDATELQLDVDVPTADLADYADFLAGLDLDVPLTITALPDWLRSPAFPDVLDAVDGWTLQVHAPGQAFHLPDLSAVPRDRPFRIALPTYGVGLVKDREGVTVGVVGEGR